MAYEEGHEVGVYRNNDDKSNMVFKKGATINFMDDVIDTFDKWYDLVKSFVYGDETFHEGLRVCIKLKK